MFDLYRYIDLSGRNIMDLGWLLFAILFVFVLIGATKAVFKPWLKNILRLACVPIAFFVTFLLQLAGIISMISNSLVSLINISDIMNESNIRTDDGETLVRAFASSLISSVLFVMIFILILVLLRCIAVNLIFKAISKKDTADKENIGKAAISCICGAVCGFLVLGVVFTPLFYVSSFAYSAVSTVRTGEEYDDSNIYRALKVVDDEVVYPLESCLAMKAYKYTGMFSLMNKSAEAGGMIVYENGRTSAKKTVDNVLENGISAVVMIQSEKGNDDKLSENISALSSDGLLLSIIADIAKDSVSSLASDATDGEVLESGIVDTIAEHYSKAEKEDIVTDIKILADTAVYLNDRKLLSKIIDEKTQSDAFSGIISDKELLYGCMDITSELSPFDELMLYFCKYEIDSLNSVFGIPENDEEAYDKLIGNILSAMNDTEYRGFDPKKVESFVEDLAASGKKITLISENESEKDLYENWKEYEKLWVKLQGAFSAACEDMTLGYVWYVSSDGSLYFYDSETYVWQRSDTVESGYASSAPLCQYLALKTQNVRFGTGGRLTGREVTYEDLRDFLKGYPAWLSEYKKCGSDTERLSKKLLDKEAFVSNAVTIETMVEKLDFESWDDRTKKEDIRPLAEIIVNIKVITEELEKAKGSTDVKLLSSLMDQFDLLGTTLDIMARTHSMSEIPELFVEGMLQDDIFRTYLSAGIVKELNDSVRSDDPITYSSFMRSMKSMVSLVIDRINGEEEK